VNLPELSLLGQTTAEVVESHQFQKMAMIKTFHHLNDHVEMIWRLADICLMSKLKYIFYGHNEKEITKKLTVQKPSLHRFIIRH